MINNSKITVGLVGFGHWGQNLAKSLQKNPDFQLLAIADINEGNRALAKDSFSSVDILVDPYKVINDSLTEAIVISTPAETHKQLCTDALLADKHVIVTKPLALSARDAEDLQLLSTKRNLVLLVDHTYLYSPAIDVIKNVFLEKTIGRPLYFESSRTGFGIFKSAVNVVDDLSVHDLAIIDFIFDSEPKSVACRYHASFPELRENLAYIMVKYPNGLTAHITSHWYSPLKQRQIVIAGDKGMIVWDDTRTTNKVALYDYHLNFIEDDAILGRAPVDYHSGSVEYLFCPVTEPLRAELSDFAKCIRLRSVPKSEGLASIRVMKMVEAAHTSASQGGTDISVRFG